MIKSQACQTASDSGRLPVTLTKKWRVESDTKLSNEIVRFLLRACVTEFRQELTRTGLGNRAEVSDKVVLCHPDAGISDMQHMVVLISLRHSQTHIIGIIKANDKHDTEAITFCVICNYLSRPHLNQIQCVHLASNMMHVWPFIAKNLFCLWKNQDFYANIAKTWTTNAAVLALNVLHVSMVEISTNSQ